MYKLRFNALICSAVVVILTSCGSNEQKNNTESTSSDTTSMMTTTATPPSTTVTTPQNMLVVTHRVSDYAKWKLSFDAHDSMKLASGIHNYVIGRSIDDSNMLLVATTVDDVEKAKAFTKDPSLKQAMQKGGVTGKPTFDLVQFIFQDTATLSTDIRSRTTFTVKDFESWRKSFESHKQTRMDNGLTDRAYGHDVDDDHKVTLVVAVNDTAKARAFWKSDLIKQQRADAGVISEPKRFVYRVVQRY